MRDRKKDVDQDYHSGKDRVLARSISQPVSSATIPTSPRPSRSLPLSLGELCERGAGRVSSRDDGETDLDEGRTFPEAYAARPRREGGNGLARMKDKTGWMRPRSWVRLTGAMLDDGGTPSVTMRRWPGSFGRSPPRAPAGSLQLRSRVEQDQHVLSEKRRPRGPEARDPACRGATHRLRSQRTQRHHDREPRAGPMSANTRPDRGAEEWWGWYQISDTVHHPF